MAATSWAPVVAFLLLLPLLPSGSASAVGFMLKGNVYPAGQYYVTMKVGEPPMPYFFDVDTGGTITWLECDAGHDTCKTCNKGPHGLYKATKNKLVPCADRRCDALHKDLGTAKDCENTPLQCNYKVSYVDGAQSVGVLITDKFSFANAGHTDIAFGCGYAQVDKDKGKRVAVDGVLGLGRGSADFVSQLKSKGLITKNVIIHCLGRKDGGRLVLGELKVYPKQITWVPMAKLIPGKDNHYSAAQQATLQLDKEPVDAKQQVTVLFDSGSSYTYLPPGLYELLISALKRSLSRSSTLREVKDPALILCWARPAGFKSLDNLKAEFKPVVSLKFGKGEAAMMIPPENYLVITQAGNACMGMLPMANLDVIIVGDITMQDQLVVYDNEGERLGWMHQPCASPSISAIMSRM